jgi:hypothetical protein
MSYLFCSFKICFKENSLYYFHKKLKIEENPKKPKKLNFSGFFRCFFLGVHWVGFFGGFLLPTLPGQGPPARGAEAPAARRPRRPGWPEGRRPGRPPHRRPHPVLAPAAVAALSGVHLKYKDHHKECLRFQF